MYKILGVWKSINKFFGYISGFLVVLSALVMFYDVINRYFLNTTSLFAPFIASFLMLGAVFLGTSWALQAGGHVHVEIIVDKFKLLIKKTCYTLGYCLSIVFVAVFLRASWGLTVRAFTGSWRAVGNLPMPSVILYGVMVFGLAMLMISLVVKIIETWYEKAESRE